MSEHSSTTTGVEGKVIAITGASSGIGAAIAEHLAQRGASVVLGARREDRLAEVVARIEAAGGAALAVEVDVRHRDDLARLVASAQQHHGRLDVLVSNAGNMTISGFDELRQDDWDEMVATNLTGVLNGIGAALPVFRAQGAGHFIHMSSTSAHRIVPTQGVYAATKTAVRVLSEALRQEAGPDLRVTVVSPGMTDTEGVRSGAVDEQTASRVREVAQPPSAIARAVAYAIEQPAGVDVGEIIVRPTAQS
ncbi:SDR family oxidoreductase [Saccharopolyspora dendranthemae]|uniref:NADP-dependent 3-hydroxy acid dehydrogenase YdfG n=1 Tax=Saccharopolyspora dendranthemae TaxID=1181886 RepID=A0A561U9B2_9PSEU|nr:SDR family oxidoreductase [Saccharopolyspora dendranthemae]TWF95944.1 NADP-dependent 3-hydroxy acid dehydrogenase YdfG [Saccharopolyspora dendranthemae]